MATNELAIQDIETGIKKRIRIFQKRAHTPEGVLLSIVRPHTTPKTHRFYRSLPI